VNVSKILPLTKDLLQDAVRANNWNPSIDDEGDIFVKFARDPDYGQETMVWLFIQGDEKIFFSQEIWLNAKFPADSWKHILMLTNDYNARYRWPRAWVLLPDEDDPFVWVRCGLDLELSTGVHLDLLAKLIYNGATGADLYFRKIIVESKILPVSEAW
jgi:Putative bacterial sensory transduction regulator